MLLLMIPPINVIWYYAIALKLTKNTNKKYTFFRILILITAVAWTIPLILAIRFIMTGSHIEIAHWNICGIILYSLWFTVVIQVAIIFDNYNITHDFENAEKPKFYKNLILFIVWPLNMWTIQRMISEID